MFLFVAVCMFFFQWVIAWQPLVVPPQRSLMPGLWTVSFTSLPPASSSSSSPSTSSSSSSSDSKSPILIGEREFLVVDSSRFPRTLGSNSGGGSSSKSREEQLSEAQSHVVSQADIRQFSHLWSVKSVIRSTHYEKHRYCTPPNIPVPYCVCS